MSNVSDLLVRRGFFLKSLEDRGIGCIRQEFESYQGPLKEEALNQMRLNFVKRNFALVKVIQDILKVSDAEVDEVFIEAHRRYLAECPPDHQIDPRSVD